MGFTFKQFGIALGIVAAFVIACIFAFHAEKAEKQRFISPAQPILEGEHVLRKMGESVGNDTKASSSFFLISGSTSAESNTSMAINFAWRMSDGTYAGSTLPLSKVRFSFDENAVTPTVKFRWLPCRQKCTVDNLMTYYVQYMVISIRESDWPKNINLPLN